MINLYADQVCQLLIQFSHDGSTIHSQLTKNTTVNINEFTTAVKGARYFRAIVSTDSLITTNTDIDLRFSLNKYNNN